MSAALRWLREATRARLLDAAAKVFSERGYQAATMDGIGSEAGLSKGGLYWIFASKEELFFALIEERVDRPLQELFERIKGASTEADTAPWTSEALAAMFYGQRELVLLFHEYWALAVRDARLRKRYVERQRRLRKAMGEAFETRYERTGVPLSMPGERLAAAVMALAEGMSIEHLADPEATPEELPWPTSSASTRFALSRPKSRPRTSGSTRS